LSISFKQWYKAQVALETRKLQVYEM